MIVPSKKETKAGAHRHLDNQRNKIQQSDISSDNLETVLLLIKAGRFHSPASGFLLYLIGGLFAIRTGAPFGVFAFLAGYIVCGLDHLSGSYSNDYFDRHTDDPGKRTMFSGRGGVLVQRLGLARAALACAVLLTRLSQGGVITVFSINIKNKYTIN